MQFFSMKGNSAPQGKFWLPPGWSNGVGRGHRSCWRTYSPQDSLHTKNYPAYNVSNVETEKSCPQAIRLFSNVTCANKKCGHRENQNWVWFQGISLILLQRCHRFTSRWDCSEYQKVVTALSPSLFYKGVRWHQFKNSIERVRWKET